MSTSDKTKKLQLLGGFAKKAEVDSLSEAIADKQPKTLVVTVTENEDGTYSASHTAKEIYDYNRLNNLATIRCLFYDFAYESVEISEGECRFRHLATWGSEICTNYIDISDEYGVSYYDEIYDPFAIPLPYTAQVGQMFRVSEVDEKGRVTKVEAVDVYTESEIDTMFGSYVNDIANLIGGEAIADS